MVAYCDRQYAEAQLQEAIKARMRLEQYAIDAFGTDGIKILDRIREKAYHRFMEENQDAHLGCTGWS